MDASTLRLSLGFPVCASIRRVEASMASVKFRASRAFTAGPVRGRRPQAGVSRMPCGRS